MRDVDGARVLVVGAAGFIGSNLVRALLEHGATVAGIVRPESSLRRLADVQDDIELIVADVRAAAALEEAVSRARPELAVSLALPRGHPSTARERLAQLDTSVLGTARLVDALARHGCTRLVHVGSSLEYGPKAGAIAESELLAPVWPRGAAKAAGTLVCLAWARAAALPALVLRPFSVYGPWEEEDRLVPAAIRAALEETELPLTEPGLVHDFVYVGDVVDAIVLGLEAPADADGEIVNIGSGVQTSNEGLVAALGRVVDCDISVRPGAYVTSPHDSRTWVADVERARALLGWTPGTPLEEGLRRTVAWFESEAVVS